MPNTPPPRHPTPFPQDVVAAVKRLEERMMKALDHALTEIRMNVALLTAPMHLGEKIEQHERRITALEARDAQHGSKAIDEIHAAVEEILPPSEDEPPNAG